MREVSPAEVYRQIKREGARHGLFPVIRDGKCFVAQRERFADAGGTVGAMVTEPSIICGVTMAAPLSNVWKSRKTRHEFNSAEVYRAANAARKAAKRAEMEENFRRRTEEMKSLQKFYGTEEIMRALAEARARGLIKMGH